MSRFFHVSKGLKLQEVTSISHYMYMGFTAGNLGVAIQFLSFRKHECLLRRYVLPDASDDRRPHDSPCYYIVVLRPSQLVETDLRKSSSCKQCHPAVKT
ncbi:hypothetical protein M431DRAFT_509674 [Trichoderma harzianum CBS 226.95]|uniref:Uncharacterized protein n=1 Tax=Trichoderma harzianum CBS 226.95 TaxID=983964 RepID=A0A2T4A8L9_TRIHA|nr:hypothetical protein M431DRAFT_509674 [Trichoderma harzianum CBS 226.95]PTB53401.1 hypothetical protein M431DRAFT_509674 [Trichoderma harzianum CBS 226.95]